MSAEERMDTEEEGADQESPNCDEESEIEDSDRSSASETESSEVDEFTIEHRKSECIADGQELEQAFQLVKNLLYEEKMKKIDNKLDALKEETAQEYLQPIKQLNEDYKQALKICDILKDLRLKLVEVQYDSEVLAAHQNTENEKRLLYDSVRAELEEKIRRLEEDRHNVDINSDLWESQAFPKKTQIRRGRTTPAKPRRPKLTPISDILFYSAFIFQHF
ncbi:BRMS1L [Bugula neritina]|uniref:BRMS1L n=1 Tax=Bugula neritina TaxID=10212 RepID=A0A7J7ISS8_BUGNE|nr:BRMS1L [Bugula neritina]